MKAMSDAHRHLASYDKPIEGRREHVKAWTAFGPRRRVLGLAKRMFDIVFALAALIFVAPLFGVIMLAILLLDGRPIFYRHVRLEPPRVCRRPFGLSYAAIAGASSMA